MEAFNPLRPINTSPACDKAGTLIMATRRLLARDERPIETLAAELGVPFYWLKSFKAGDIDAPSVNRVQFIYEKLSGHKMMF